MKKQYPNNVKSLAAIIWLKLCITTGTPAPKQDIETYIYNILKMWVTNINRPHIISRWVVDSSRYTNHIYPNPELIIVTGEATRPQWSTSTSTVDNCTLLQYSTK